MVSERMGRWLMASSMGIISYQQQHHIQEMAKQVNTQILYKIIILEHSMVHLEAKNYMGNVF